MRSSALIVAALVLTLSGAAQAEESPAPCTNNGSLGAMMVPNKYVAESIYRAVGGALAPRNFRKYPNVVVEDGGDHWSVSQTIAPPFGAAPKPAGDKAAATTGGGQLHMDIDKCTGAISHAALAR